MTAPIAPDPQWQRILASDAEDEAWQELTDRNDRLREHAPAAGFKYHHDKEQHSHDQAQDHPDRHRADRPVVAPGPRGRRDVGHRPADLTGAERDRAVEELMEWLHSDRLDWDAVERAHRAARPDLGPTVPKHPGPSQDPHRGDPVPPNAAPTIAVPAGEAHAPAGNQPEERTP